MIHENKLKKKNKTVPVNLKRERVREKRLGLPWERAGA